MTKKAPSLQEQLAERQQHIEHLEAKYEHMRTRYIRLRQKSDWAISHPIRYALRCWYHKYIKRDWIV